jgi:hypothetical protein
MQENNIDLSEIRKLGVVPVRLEGEIYTAPFSQKVCVWFEWIHGAKGIRPDRGYTPGYGTGHKSRIIVKTNVGDLTVWPDRSMLYIAASFNDKAVVDGEEKYIKEFCLEPDQTYYAFTEKFIYHLPPIRFLPFIPRRKTTWLLALSDQPLEKGRPVHPLIPTRRGLTG